MKADVIDNLTRAIMEHVREIEPLFDLPGIDVEHKFLDTRMEEDQTCAAQTVNRWEYRDAQIVWYLPMVAHLEGMEELRNVVFHEYCHVLLAPLEDRLKAGSEKYDELAVESISRAMRAAYAATCSQEPPVPQP